jgi:hypothetical protein
MNRNTDDGPVMTARGNLFRIALTLGLALLLLVPPPADAGRRGSSSSSWGRSSSTSRTTTSRSSSFGRSSGSSWGTRSSSGWGTRSTRASQRTTTPTSSWGRRSSTTTARVPKPRTASKADQAAYRKAAQYNSFNREKHSYRSPQTARAEAVEDFQKKFAPQYPSKFDKKPEKRPEYIPGTVEVGRTKSPVEYRVENGVGGYYYRNAAGAWILYNLMRDTQRRDRYMYRHGYDPTGTTYTRARSSGGGSPMFWLFLGIVLVVLLVLGAVIAVSYFSAFRDLPPGKPGRRRKEKRPRPPPPAPTRGQRPLLSPTETGYWLQAKPGDTFILRDEQTLEMLMKERRADFTHGVSLTVRVVRTLTERNNLMKWVICELEPVRLADGEQVWYLVVKVVDREFDLRVMFEPADFRPGSRQDLIDAGTTWLFQPPQDEANFRPEDLEFTMSFDQALEGGRTVIYNRKGQGVLYGEMREQPPPSGIPQPQFVAVVEFRADTPCENPEVLIVEMGGVDDPRRGARDAGGFIVLLQGANVSPADLELLSV